MAGFALALTGPRSVSIVEEAVPSFGIEEVRLQTLYSGISAGTELALYRGTNPYLHKRWDDERRLFVEDEKSVSTPFPVTSWGYEEVGEVVEAGPESGVAVGDVVFGTWGHRSQHVCSGDYARARVLRAGTDPLVGIFSHIGPTALNGVLDSAVRLGETAAVFGLGVVGQLCAQLLKLSGARVVGADLLASRRQLAEQLGLERAIDPSAGPTAEQIKDLSGGRGADVCIEASGSTLALHEAIRACAYNGRVVALGFYQGQAQGLLLGEEFHHNRISLVCSQVGGIAPELQHRWNRPRLVHTFMDLAMSGAVDCTRLVTHRVAVRQAADVYQLLDERPQLVLQAVLDFRPDT
jgi:2-desacetyl-2-hydroxyethyl bacteriochlorophyllide A dehydrogenase